MIMQSCGDDNDADGSDDDDSDVADGDDEDDNYDYCLSVLLGFLNIMANYQLGKQFVI